MVVPRSVPYRGGFVLTRANFESVAHFERRDLPGGWFWWRDDSVREAIAHDGVGNLAIVRGHWADTTSSFEEQAEIAETLLKAFKRSEDAFHEVLSCLSGRYVVVVRTPNQTRLYHDAIGLRSIAYSVKSALVASHVNLLAELETHSVHMTAEEALPAFDETPLAGIRVLLPNFYLEPESAQVKRFFPQESNKFSSMEHGEKMELVEDIWKSQLDVYAKLHPRMAISVTGGLDTRLMLAMAQDHVGSYLGFTYGFDKEGGSKWSEVLSSDFRIVRELLPISGLKEHRFFDISNKASSGLKELLDKNCWRPHGRFLISHLRNAMPEDDWMHIRGNGVEITRRIRANPNPSFDQMAKRYFRATSPELLSRGKVLGYDGDLAGYSRGDLAHWETRMGKWHTEIVNEQDAVYDTLLPIGTRRILDVLISYSQQSRKNTFHVHELINRNAPLLNFVGFNETSNLYEKRRDELLNSDGSSKDPEHRYRESKFTEVKMKVSGQDCDPPELENQAIQIPSAAFRPGTSIEGRIFRASRPGTLRFQVNKPFANRKAQGRFEWSIVVDGRVMSFCDGSISGAVANVTIVGLSIGSEVGVRLLVHNGTPSAHWSNASKTLVEKLYFVATSSEEELAIAFDSPHVKLMS